MILDILTNSKVLILNMTMFFQILALKHQSKAFLAPKSKFFDVDMKH